MLVEFNVRESRQAEIEVLVQHVAKQFNVTDPLDIADLRTAILNKVDTSSPLAEYVPTDRASSASFRANTRNAYIDLIAYFIQLRDIEAALRFAEYESRKVFDDFDERRKRIDALIQPEDTDLVHRETFTDEVENGIYDGTRVHDGRLSLQMEDVSPPYRLKGITASIHPAANSRERIFHSTTGELDTVLDTGLGSKLWSVDVYTPIRPEMYWTKSISGSNSSEGANYLHEGILIDLKLTLTKAIKLNYISAKFLTPTRLVRAYIDISKEGATVPVWEPLITSDRRFVQTWDYDRTLEAFDFQAPEASNRIRLVCSVSQPENIVGQDFILDRMYSRKEIFQGVASNDVDFPQQVLLPDSFLYSFGIYNIRLRNRRPIVNHGSFTSNEYVTNQGAIIGAKLKAVDSGGALVYSVRFGHRSEMALLPEGASRNVEELVDVDDLGFAFLSFPAEPGSVKSKEQHYRFTPHTREGKNLGTVFTVVHNKTGETVRNTKNVPISYRASQTSRYVFTNEYVDEFSDQYAGDPGGVATIFTRVSEDFWEETPRVSVYEAVPVCVYNISETFFGQSLLELEQIPWIDYSGNHPVEIAIQATEGGDPFSNLTHPDLLMDRTNYYNRRVQPMLENFDVVDRYEFLVQGNNIYMNTAQYHQLQIIYPVKTEGVRVRIDQQAKGHTSPWVDDYTLHLTVQKD